VVQHVPFNVLNIGQHKVDDALKPFLNPQFLGVKAADHLKLQTICELKRHVADDCLYTLAYLCDCHNPKT